MVLQDRSRGVLGWWPQAGVRPTGPSAPGTRAFRPREGSLGGAREGGEGKARSPAVMISLSVEGESFWGSSLPGKTDTHGPMGCAWAAGKSGCVIAYLPLQFLGSELKGELLLSSLRALAPAEVRLCPHTALLDPVVSSSSQMSPWGPPGPSTVVLSPVPCGARVQPLALPQLTKPRFLWVSPQIAKGAGRTLWRRR